MPAGWNPAWPVRSCRGRDLPTGSGGQANASPGLRVPPAMGGVLAVVAGTDSAA
jgi:hypothetical protein